MTIAENYSQPPQVGTREPVVEDLEKLESILALSLIDADTGEPIQEEIVSVLDRIKKSMDSEDSPFRYLVAESPNGNVLGVMGITRPDEDMIEYAQTPDACVELVNAFVDPSLRKTGAGKALVTALLEQARANGATEVVVNSGPRYRVTGWPFWANVISGKRDVDAEGYGETALLEDKYGEGLDAMVWRKDLA